MARVFYTGKDIEDMVKQGVKSLEITENVILTSLAYEKALALGLSLVSDKLDELPNAPVRPYLNKIPVAQPTATSVSTAPVESLAPPPPAPPRPPTGDLQQRLTSAVMAKMGDDVDPALLASIVRRVLVSTGLK